MYGILIECPKSTAINQKLEIALLAKLAYDTTDS